MISPISLSPIENPKSENESGFNHKIQKIEGELKRISIEKQNAEGNIINLTRQHQNELLSGHFLTEQYLWFSYCVILHFFIVSVFSRIARILKSQDRIHQIQNQMRITRLSRMFIADRVTPCVTKFDNRRGRCTCC